MKQPKQHLRLATRDSKLALWQAQFIQKKLKSKGVSSELVFVKSKGDLLQKKSVQTLNSVGIFTKAIDHAVLEGRADAGVHSLKDLPTTLHDELMIGCVPEREDASDVLVFKDKDFFKNIKGEATIATGSARRKAQWLNKYPHHKIVGVRGNVDSRLQKLQESNWDGMILAAAGLKRLKIKTLCKKLSWMIHAPGQGAVVVVHKKKDKDAGKILSELNHRESLLAVLAERTFLSLIDAGCSAAVGAAAQLSGKNLFLKAEVLSADGREKIVVELIDKLENAMRLGQKAAKIALEQGAKQILKS